MEIKNNPSKPEYLCIRHFMMTNFVSFKNANGLCTGLEN